MQSIAGCRQLIGASQTIAVLYKVTGRMDAIIYIVTVFVWGGICKNFVCAREQLLDVVTKRGWM